MEHINTLLVIMNLGVMCVGWWTIGKAVGAMLYKRFGLD